MPRIPQIHHPSGEERMIRPGRRIDCSQRSARHGYSEHWWSKAALGRARASGRSPHRRPFEECGHPARSSTLHNKKASSGDEARESMARSDHSARAFPRRRRYCLEWEATWLIVQLASQPGASQSRDGVGFAPSFARHSSCSITQAAYPTRPGVSSIWTGHPTPIPARGAADSQTADRD